MFFGSGRRVCSVADMELQKEIIFVLKCSPCIVRGCRPQLDKREGKDLDRESQKLIDSVTGVSIVVMVVVLLVTGLFYFRRMERGFADMV